MALSANDWLNELIHRSFTERPLPFRVYWHPQCLLHDPGCSEANDRMPEGSDRLLAILYGLHKLPHSLPITLHISAPAEEGDLVRVHDRHYLDFLKDQCANGASHFMSEQNPIEPRSFEAILAAGGQALALARHMLEGGAGFALTRPPGHHAHRANAEGYCFINHAALMAERINRDQPEARILLVDFSGGRGFGTDTLFQAKTARYLFSIHSNLDDHPPLVRGRGKETRGLTQDIEVNESCSAHDWLSTFADNLQHAADLFRPDYIIVSAGFDAHKEDPLHLLRLDDETYLAAVTLLTELAEQHTGGRIGFCLEGGYSEAVLKRLVPRIISHLSLHFNAAVNGASAAG